MTDDTQGPDDERTGDGPAGPGHDAADRVAVDDPARTAPDVAEEELPELAPHLKNRPDRPRDPSEIAQGRSQARLILLLLFAALPAVVLVVVVLNSLASGPPDRSADGAHGELNEVSRYCTYSTQKGQDYDDCLKRADVRVIRREQTNAGRYARGELTRCLPDAGPRCTLR